MDVFTVFPRAKISEAGIGQVHGSIDAFPLSMDKIRAAFDLVDNPDDRLGIIFKFGKYHSVWNDIRENNFITDYTSSLGKGGDLKYKHVTREPWEEALSYDGIEFDNISMTYLRKIVELCQREEIEIVLINTGYDANKESQYFASAIPDLANEFKVEYIDFTQLNIVDLNTDLCTSGENTHLNVSGGQKMTSYLGEVLRTKYFVEDKRGNLNYTGWNEDYKVYLQYKMFKIFECNNLAEELVSIADNDFSVIIYINNSEMLLKDDVTKALIKNVSSAHELKNLEMAIEIGEDYLLVVDNKKQEVFEGIGQGNFETSFGNVTFYGHRSGTQGLYLNDWSDKLYYNGIQPDMQILVIDNETGGLIAQTRWSGGKKI